jgi:hypothetical protein
MSQFHFLLGQMSRELSEMRQDVKDIKLTLEGLLNWGKSLGILGVLYGIGAALNFAPKEAAELAVQVLRSLK